MSVDASRYHALRVSAVVDETPDSKSLVFDVPAELADLFHYRPGQFLTLRLPVQERHVPRCYSMSSTPTLDAAPRVTIKRVAGGRGSNWVCDQIKPGDRIEVLPPAGVFTPATLAGDFLLFAGGSGVTPVFSILRAALASGNGKICLIYANRDEQSVIFQCALDELRAAYPERLEIVHRLDSVQGIPTLAQFAELARPWRQAQAFICGPAAFMDLAVAALHSLDMAPERIHVERFVSLPDEEDQIALNAESPVGVVQAKLHVQLDGQAHEVVCEVGETLLEAAIRAGLNPPSSCQAGMCASCMCRVTAGEVHLRHNEVLDKNDLAKGWTLACQALPMSAQISIKFPE